jgi:hypothetical protein
MRTKIVVFTKDYSCYETAISFHKLDRGDHVLYLKGLSYETDLAFDDMNGLF